MNCQLELWHGRESSQLVECAIPERRTETDVLVRAEKSLISLGTEKLVLSENLFADAEHRMRVPYMRGNFSSKFTYGYSMVGEIIDGPCHMVSRRVHLMHPHQRYALVDCSDVFVLPESLSTIAATLISNLETCVTAIWDSTVSIGDKVMVYGYGTIGLLLCFLLDRIPGVELLLVEPDPARASIARANGVAVCRDAASIEGEMDIAFNTAVAQGALQSAIDSVGLEGRTVELGWYGSRSTTLALGGAFHYNRKKIISSQVSTIPTFKSDRWDNQRRKNLVVKLAQLLAIENDCKREVKFEESADFYNKLRTAQTVEPVVVLDYEV